MPVQSTNHKWGILFTACLLTVMLNLDFTAVTVAIPVISHQFHTSLSTIQWVVNAFVLLSAMFQILGGRAGDIYGHRRLYIIGTLIFILSSALAGFAQGPTLLIIARILQGFSLGIAYPMTLVLILTAFPKEEHGTAIGILMGTMGASMALGPTIGGILVHYLTWRWIFFVNLPIGILTLFCTYLFCKKDNVPATKEKISWTSGTLLCLGLLGVILPLNQAQEWGITSTTSITTFIIGILFIAGLAWYEKGKQSVLFDFSVFKNKAFNLNIVIRIIGQMVLLPVLFFLPLYFQNILGISALKSGLILITCTVFVGVMSVVAGRFVDKFGASLPNKIALLLLLIGCVILAQASTYFIPFIIYSALFFIGLGVGINFVATATGALSDIPQAKSGAATGVLMTIILGSCALGVAVFGLILSHGANVSVLAKATALGLHHDSPTMQMLSRVSHGLSPVSALAHQLSNNLNRAGIISLAKSAYLHGFQQGFWVLTILSAIGFLLSFGHTRKSLKQPDNTQ